MTESVVLHHGEKGGEDGHERSAPRTSPVEVFTKLDIPSDARSSASTTSRTDTAVAMVRSTYRRSVAAAAGNVAVQVATSAPVVLH